MVQSASNQTHSTAQVAAQSSKWTGSRFSRLLRQRHGRARPLGETSTVPESILAISRLSCLNELLIFIPLSWIFHFRGTDDALVFICSFFAIIPLSKLLSFATGDLRKHVGQTLATLIQATLGNTVELTLALTSLFHCNLKVVQLCLIGSILFKLLLIPGMCFFAGGIRFSEQGFGARATHINSSLLMLSMVAMLLPSASNVVLRPEVLTGGNPGTNRQEAHDILAISHGVAIILLIIYLSCLVFQLFSHKNLYENSDSSFQRSVLYTPKHGVAEGETTVVVTDFNPTSGLRHSCIDEFGRDRAERDLEASGSVTAEEEDGKLSLLVTITLLIVITVCLCITTESLVKSMDGLTARKLINNEFVGLVVLPILGNAQEIKIAIKESVKDKLTLTLGVVLGSSIQITLFVFPFVTTVAWILGKPLTLFFNLFESTTLFLSVFAVHYVVKGGKSNWLKGIILVCLYAIVAVIFWYYPASDFYGLIARCA